MPRKSAAELAIAPASVSVMPTRAQPPPNYSGAAAAIWREIAASRPPDFFDKANLRLLDTFCRATAEANRLEDLAAGLDPVSDIDAFAKLSRLVDMHRSRANQCLTRLRLTKQSVTDSRGAGRAANGNRGPASLDQMIEAYRHEG